MNARTQELLRKAVEHLVDGVLDAQKPDLLAGAPVEPTKRDLLVSAFEPVVYYIMEAATEEALRRSQSVYCNTPDKNALVNLFKDEP